MSEKFCLKWNDFITNTTRAFSLSRREDFLQDVTLIGEDNHQVSAHRLVLSSCSEYFKNIFKNNRHSHPLLCLEGVALTDLDNILNYMYDGEVKIYQDDLDRFLTIAQRFKLEGLLSDGDPQQKEEEKHWIEETTLQPPENMNKDLDLKPKRRDRNDRQIARVGNEDFKITMTQEEKNNLDLKVNQHVDRREDGLFQCNLCGKSAKQKIEIKNHIEAKHLEGVEIPCSICGKTFRSRNTLCKHRTTVHKLK